jgi:HlyD family secretion protein
MRRLLTRQSTWAALAGAALLAWAFWPAAVVVDVAPVTRAVLRVTIDEEGETRVRHRYVMSAPVAGRLMRVTLRPGDPVRAGDTVLASFAPAAPALLDARSQAEAQARVAAADDTLRASRADRDRIAADLSFANKNLDRARSLVAAGAIAQDSVDAAERDVRTREEGLHAAEFAAETAAHHLEVARASLLQAEGKGQRRPIAVRSPVDGVVLRVHHESETVLTPGQPVVEVGDVRHLEVVTDLLTRDAARVRPGQPAIFERWGGDTSIRGRVRMIEPSAFTKVSALGVEEQRVNVVLDFDDPATAAALGDGYRLDVGIIVWERADVLTAPVGCLFVHDGRPAVFAARRGRAVLAPVETGQRNGIDAEILSGLAEGDEVVMYPSDRVRDGVRITPR